MKGRRDFTVCCMVICIVVLGEINDLNSNLQFNVVALCHAGT